MMSFHKDKPQHLAESSDSEPRSKEEGPAVGHQPWWQGRIFLATLLATLLSTYFMARAAYSKSGPIEADAVEPESVSNSALPIVPLLAVGICWFTDLLLAILQSEKFDRTNPVASVLSATLVRTMVILGALGLSSATKWPAHNLFGNYLVGCYFSFLALESSLAIRRSATRNYSPKPL